MCFLGVDSGTMPPPGGAAAQPAVGGVNIALVLMVAPWMIFIEIVLAHRVFLLNAMHHKVHSRSAHLPLTPAACQLVLTLVRADRCSHRLIPSRGM